MLHPAPRFFVLLLALSTVPTLLGCSRQKEGERCSTTNSNSDCEDSLVCTELRDAENETIHRCCPEAGEPYTDARCELDAIVGDGDTSSEGGAGGMMSSEGEPAGIGENCVRTNDCEAPLACNSDRKCASVNCVYPSDCAAPFVCRGGKCNHECKSPRDCDAGETCSREQVCVAE